MRGLVTVSAQAYDVSRNVLGGIAKIAPLVIDNFLDTTRDPHLKIIYRAHTWIYSE